MDPRLYYNYTHQTLTTFFFGHRKGVGSGLESVELELGLFRSLFFGLASSRSLMLARSDSRAESCQYVSIS